MQKQGVRRFIGTLGAPDASDTRRPSAMGDRGFAWPTATFSYILAYTPPGSPVARRHEP